jgi:serine-threonine kinase receptor-associated protein
VLVRETLTRRFVSRYWISRFHSVSDALSFLISSLTQGSRVWDTQTGECLNVLTHQHIVKAVAFPVQRSPQAVATGGQEKKLRIWDLARSGPRTTSNDGIVVPETLSDAIEIGAGDHTASIKSIVWNVDYNIVTTAADDKTIRWYDLRVANAIKTFKTDKDILSCELSTNRADDPEPGILSVAAGQSAYFFDANDPGRLLKKADFDHDIASVGIHPLSGRFVTGGKNDTWVRVWDLEPQALLGEFLCMER